MGARVLILALAASTITACDTPEPSAVNADGEARAAMAAAQRAWSDALIRNDMDSLVSLYTEDAVLIPPGTEVRGREEIRRWFSQDSTWHNVSHSTEAHEVSVYDSVAVEYGTWRNSWRVADGPEQSGSEKYIVFWKRGADGQWRIHYDIWHFPPDAVIPAPAP